MKRTPLKRKTPLATKRAIRKKANTPPAALKRQALALWGEYIHRRDVYCQLCGKGDGKLDAHHIYSRRFNATATDETNGVLLCSWTCHHRGVHGDDQEAAREFYVSRLSEHGYLELRRKALGGVGQRFGAPYWREEIARLTRLLEAL